jgi:acetyltransferase-like isoleucine patch superfamily enzyme
MNDLAALAPDLRSGPNLRLAADRIHVGRGVTIGANVDIRAGTLTLGDGVRIGDDVVIDAEDIAIGWGTAIESRCRIAAMAGRAELVRIGEQSLLGHDSKLLVPRAAIGDYTTIHNHCLLNGYAPMVLGHNNWVGQNCILNSEAPLTIGNHVGIGAYSCVYTHGYFGDLLEGSQVWNVGPVTIEDDAWLLGSYNVVSPGVIIGAKALVLTGSTVTKNVPANHTVGGSPARDMTERIVPYVEVPMERKLELMRGYVEEFQLAKPGVAEFHLGAAGAIPQTRPLIAIVPDLDDVTPAEGLTIIDLRARRYVRARTAGEAAFLRFLRSFRGRFVPADHPRVTIDAAGEAA